MNLQTFITIFAAFTVSLSACSTAVPNPGYDTSITGMAEKKTIDFRSKLSEHGGGSPWDVKTYKVERRPYLTSVFFLDEKHGWVGGKESLYKSTDGGASWEQIKLALPTASEVSSIFFLNPSLGWVAVQRYSKQPSGFQESQYWLFQTKDGGASWNLQKSDQGAIVTKVFFTDEAKGWFIGVKFGGSEPLSSNYLIMHTSDQGQHYADVSVGVNRLAANERGFVVGRLSDIIPTGDTSVAVLAGTGKIYITTDDGRTWKAVETVSDEPPQACICRLGRTADNRLWVAGGAFSDEGVWGTLAIERNGDSWARYRLSDVYFKDVALLSNQQAFAAGSIPVSANDRSAKYGVVVYTADGGANWDVIYRDERVSSINSLAAAGNDHVWAVGGDGLILSLTLKP